MPSPNEQICQIRIMFPVVSDEEAIEIKKKVTELLSDIPDAQTNFSISSLPAKLPRS